MKCSQKTAGGRQLVAVSQCSLLSLEDVGQHGPGGGQLAHLAQELGLGILTHQTGRDGHGATGGKKRVEFDRKEATSLLY